MKPLFLLLTFWVVCSANILAQPTPTDRPLVLGTYTYDQNNRLQNLLPLAEHLEKTLQQQVKVVSYPSVPALLAAIRAREVDVSFLSTYGYLQLDQDSTPAALPLVSMVVPPVQGNGYGACLFASKVSGIQTMEDVRSRAGHVRLLLAGENSTSGNLVQRLFLRQMGLASLEASFKEVQYAQNHTQVVQQVKAGQAEVGACGLDELLHQIQNWQISLEDITVLWTTDQVPLGPVMVNTALPNHTIENIRQIFTQLHLQNPAAFYHLQQGWTEARGASQFQVIAPGHYAQALERVRK